MPKMFLSILFINSLLFSLKSNAATSFELVHGALFTSEGWSLVQQGLSDQGKSSRAINLPGRGADQTPAELIDLHYVVDKLCQDLRSREGTEILVGHSQGGAVITQALAVCPEKIKALVYIAAVVPKNGERPFDLLSAKDGEAFERCAIFDEKAKLFRINKDGPLWENFMADLPEGEAAHWIDKMVSEPSEIGTTILHYPQSLFDSIPKFYIETLKDRIVSIESQKKIQKDIHFEGIYTLDTSHSPFLSMAKDITDILVNISKSLKNSHK